MLLKKLISIITILLIFTVPVAAFTVPQSVVGIQVERVENNQNSTSPNRSSDQPRFNSSDVLNSMDRNEPTQRNTARQPQIPSRENRVRTPRQLTNQTVSNSINKQDTPSASSRPTIPSSENRVRTPRDFNSDYVREHYYREAPQIAPSPQIPREETRHRSDRRFISSTVLDSFNDNTGNHSGHDHSSHDDHSNHDDHSGHDHSSHDDHSNHDDHSGHDHSSHDDHNNTTEITTDSDGYNVITVKFGKWKIKISVGKKIFSVRFYDQSDDLTMSINVYNN